MGVLQAYVQYAILLAVGHLSSDNVMNLVLNPPPSMTSTEYCKLFQQKALTKAAVDISRKINENLSEEDWMTLKVELSDTDALMNALMKSNVVILARAMSSVFGTSDGANTLGKNSTSKMSNLEYCTDIKANIQYGLSAIALLDGFMGSESTNFLAGYGEQLQNILDLNCNEIVKDMNDVKFAKLWKQLDALIEKVIRLVDEIDLNQNLGTLTFAEMKDRAFSLLTCCINFFSSFLPEEYNILVKNHKLLHSEL